jgi:hypothetical protein
VIDALTMNGMIAASLPSVSTVAPTDRNCRM